MRPAIDLQLKATVNLIDDGRRFRFRLPRRNYDLLRTQVQTPRLLVVLDLPKQQSRWLTITTEKLVLRRCAYWANLTGRTPTANRNSITVSLEKKNIFNVDGLRGLMERSRTGTIQ